ncbi:MAG: DUF4465 domain-containing protein [Polaribacter sp.]|uniref:DUF4465 domain-containing protein n=1 Tax=Polaribacter sp. TaxID=1920175 RepID=UPI003264D058
MMIKNIQKHIRISVAIFGLVLLNSCKDSLELQIPYPNDITFNELSLDRFTYQIPTAPFTAGDNDSGIITVNVVGTGNNFSGFALSNKNFRSYPWDLSPDFAPIGGLTAAEEQASINTTAFSVYTTEPNKTQNYLVGNTEGDNAFFTLSSPSTIAHVLIANTSYNYLLAQYGAIYSDDYDSVTESYLIDGGKTSNPNIENPDSDLEGRFRLPAPGGFDAVRLNGFQNLERDAAGLAAYDAVINAGGTTDEAETAKDNAEDNVYAGYVKLTIEGFLNGSSTGTVDWYLCVNEEVDILNPEHDYILNDWQKVDLTSLGDVDKVLFKMSSDYIHTDGRMVYSPMFCLDGIRLE